MKHLNELSTGHNVIFICDRDHPSQHPCGWSSFLCAQEWYWFLPSNSAISLCLSLLYEERVLLCGRKSCTRTFRGEVRDATEALWHRLCICTYYSLGQEELCPINNVWLIEDLFHLNANQSPRRLRITKRKSARVMKRDFMQNNGQVTSSIFQVDKRWKATWSSSIQCCNI